METMMLYPPHCSWKMLGIKVCLEFFVRPERPGQRNKNRVLYVRHVAADALSSTEPALKQKPSNDHCISL